MPEGTNNYLDDLNSIDSSTNSDLSILKKEIGELLNDTKQDDGLERLSGSLTSGLSNYLKEHNNDAKTLMNVLNNLPDEYANTQEIMNLKIFLQPLIKKDWTMDSPDANILKVNLSIDSNKQRVLFSKINELKDKVTDAGLKNTLNQISQIISSPNKQNFDQLSKFLDANNVPDTGVTVDNPNYVTSVLNRLNFFLTSISSQIDTQSSIIDENDGERAYENKAYNELMSYIPGNLKKLNRMSEKDLRRLDAFIKRPNNQQQVFDLYYKMKHDVPNLNSEGMDAKDEKKFYDILNLIENKYKDSPELHEYELNKVFNGINSNSDSLNNFLKQQFNKVDWNGEDLGTDFNVSNISDNYNFSVEEFINKFNTLNKARVDSNNEKISNVNVPSLFNENLLKSFTVENGDDGKVTLKFNGEEFTAEKIFKSFEGEVENLVGFEQNIVNLVLSANPDFVSDIERNKSIWDNKDTLFQKIVQYVVEHQETTHSDAEKPEPLKLEGEMTQIDEPTEEERVNRYFYGDINKKLDDGSKTEVEQSEENIAKYIEDITALLEAGLDEDLKNNLGQIKGDLENILNVMGNPNNRDNTRVLQNFIYANLAEEDQPQFKKDNHYREGRGFDGQFGKKTLDGLKTTLKKIEDHIGNVKKYLEDKNTNDVLNKIEPEANVTFEKGSGDPDLSKWLKDLPSDATVDFATPEDKAKLNESGDQTVNLKVTLASGETKIVEVTVHLVDKAAASTGEVVSETHTDVQPLSMDGGQYLVMGNSGELSDRLGLPGATFYSVENQNPPIAVGADGKWETRNAPANGDYECFLRFEGQPDKFYRVKIDQNGNLCPVATNANSDVPVIFENNRSCMNYLLNKLPPVLQGKGISIGWNGKDYIMDIKGGKRRVTIEPMTIDNKWVGRNLTENLAFLNFTNYLRNKGEIQDVVFKGDSPDLKLQGNDLYVRVDKSMNNIGEGGKGVKWFKINKDSFGLPDDPVSLGNFVRYNNGEHRRDSNRDSRKPNRYYRPVNLG